ncbi:hypothetical protein [Tautonia sociabilis]|uniref:hypothetical protein n=1 Tax=Tautonia sociabilis TaxID=2080755 RepID=UPI0013157599|nr:hypothetical protein [Tautonia sociabilis]
MAVGEEFRHNVDLEVRRRDVITGSGSVDAVDDRGEGRYTLSGVVRMPTQPGRYELRAVAMVTVLRYGADPTTLPESEVVRTVSRPIAIEVVP